VSPCLKLAAFALALGASVGVGAAVGAAVGPIDTGDEPTHEPTTTRPGAFGPHDGGPTEHP
jgi:hypothetical protein